MNHDEQPHAVRKFHKRSVTGEDEERGVSGCRRATHRRLFVNGLDGKLLIVKGNVSDLTPGETDLWGQSGKESARTSLLTFKKAQ